MFVNFMNDITTSTKYSKHVKKSSYVNNHFSPNISLKSLIVLLALKKEEKENRKAIPKKMFPIRTATL